MKKIGFAGCKDTTLECMLQLLEDGYKIDHLITLNPEQGIKNKVAGYYDLKEFAKDNNLSIYIPKTYSLKNEEDIKTINQMDLDLLLVIGWQRLIPQDILNKLKIGACGMHGSTYPLPRGRGRSPLNWSLILGNTSFMTNLFLYKPGVDDGDIIATQEFDINEFDTAETLHIKNRISMNKLLVKSLPNLLNGKYTAQPQPETLSTYYPKREANDGVIDWNQTTISIYNLIRATTKPFPGAFTYLNDNKIMIWRAQPFDSKINYESAQNGEIVETIYDHKFIVKTKNSSLLITEYESPIKLKKGDLFLSVSLEKTISEIEKKYSPELKDEQKEITTKTFFMNYKK